MSQIIANFRLPIANLIESADYAEQEGVRYLRVNPLLFVNLRNLRNLRIVQNLQFST